MSFHGSDSKPLMTPLSNWLWNVVKFQNSEITDIFCSVYEFWQGIPKPRFNLITQILVNFQISRFNLETIVFCAVILVSSISSEIPRERLFYGFTGAINHAGCWQTGEKLVNHVRADTPVIYNLFSCAPNMPPKWFNAPVNPWRDGLSRFYERTMDKVCQWEDNLLYIQMSQIVRVV